MLNTIEIYRELRETMDEAAAETIAAHLGRMYGELRAMVKREDFLDLKAVVKALALAQKRTEVKLEELAEAQKRTEIALQELVVSHNNLEKAHHALAKQVGGLSDTIGGDIEDIAYSLVYRVLSDTFGWKIGTLERVWQRWSNEPEEVNVFAQASDPQRPSITIWLVGEAKHNLTLKKLHKFTKQVERARQHLMGEIFPFCFCYRARPEVQETAQRAGIYLLFSYGKLLYPAANSSHTQ